jgi:hypothetical protein
MDYTHYWRQNDLPNDEQWGAIQDTFRTLMPHFPIQREMDDAGPPQMDDIAIAFNGIGDDAYETMYLARSGNSRNFCKTDERPYDRAVVVLLILAEHFAPNCFMPSSDGGIADWQPALDWLNAQGVGTFKMPRAILP